MSPTLHSFIIVRHVPLFTRGCAFPLALTLTALLAPTSAIAQPANDAFASAATLSGTNPRITATNVGAAKETGEPNHAGNVGGRSVWWRWTAPVTAPVTLTATDSSFSTLLAVYTGNAVSSLTAISSSSTGQLSFQATSGTTYGVAIDGAGGSSGSIVATLEAHAYAVSIVAGAAGVAGSTDGPATTARFNRPGGVVPDANGNLFVADTVNGTIRLITFAGNVSTFAGTAGSSGTVDATGSAARFVQPLGMAFNQLGTLYVADTAGHTIRRVSSNQIVGTFAGTGGISGSTPGVGAAARFNGPRRVAFDPTSASLFVTDGDNHTIRRITSDATVTTFAGLAGSTGSTDGSGSTARFNLPFGIAVASGGTLYVSDFNNHTLRRITSAGVVTTFAGSPGIAGNTDGPLNTARFNQPAAIAIDAAGNLFVADNGNSSLRKITPSGLVVTVAITSDPVDVAVDATGTLLIADYSSHVIRKALPLTSAVTIARQPADVELISGGTATFSVTAAATSYRWQRSSDSGSTWVTLADNSTVSGATTQQLTITGATTTMSGDQFRVVVENGVASPAPSSAARLTVQSAYEVTTLAGGAQGYVDATGAAARFGSPGFMALAPNGSLLVADPTNNALRSVTSGGVVTTAVALGTPPVGVTVAANGTIYYTQASEVSYVNAGSSLLIAGSSPPGFRDGDGLTSAFNRLQGVTAVGSDLYVVDSANHAIRRIVPPRTVTTLAGNGSSGAIDGTGANARFHDPRGIAADSAGNLFVADTSNHAIRKVTPAGVVTTIAGALGSLGQRDGTGAVANFWNPQDVAVDAVGNVFVADGTNSTIRRITPGGVVTTVAGTPITSGFVNGRGSNARFNFPRGIAVDANGTLYISDLNNFAIRKAVPIFDRPGIKGALAATGTIGTNFTYTIIANSNPQSYTASGLPAGVTLNATTGVISGTPTVTGSFAVTLGATNATGPSAPAVLALEIRGAGGVPTILAQPIAASALSGGSAHFAVSATGTGTLTYRWQELVGGTWNDLSDNATYSGALTPLLTAVASTALNNRQFRVVVRDSTGGSVTSSAVTLSVTTSSTPQITSQPAAASVAPGGTTQFSIIVSNAPGLAYRWQMQSADGQFWEILEDNATFSGTTTSTLTITNPPSALNGRQFRVLLIDPTGAWVDSSGLRPTSSPVTLTIGLVASRLLNLSTRGECLTGDNVLIPGFIIGGTGTKRLLIRGVGPTLANFGVGRSLADPTIVLKRLVNGSYVDMATNNDWGTNANSAEITGTAARVGAFPLPNGSRDAVLLMDLVAGQYTVVTSGVAGNTGVAIVELYDVGGDTGDARLVNIATRGFVGIGESIMIPGFVISSEGPRTVLIRAVGPTLATFGVQGAISDLGMSLYRQNADGTSTVIGGNDNWGMGTDQANIAAVAARVGAFPLPEISLDAAMVTTLPPGAYTVQVHGIGTATGNALVEVYVVP